jgi:hypothetical protein
MKPGITLMVSGNSKDHRDKVLNCTLFITSEIDGEKHWGKIPIIFIFTDN